MDRLREQEAMARMERYGAELEDLDVGAVLAFAEQTLCDLAGSWNRAELQQKQRLQSIIFPSGVTWDGEAVRTRETARVFGWIDPICDDKERLVTPARFDSRYRRERRIHWRSHVVLKGERLSDQIMTRAQGNQRDSRVLQGTRVRARVACLTKRYAGKQSARSGLAYRRQ